LPSYNKLTQKLSAKSEPATSGEKSATDTGKSPPVRAAGISNAQAVVPPAPSEKKRSKADLEKHYADEYKRLAKESSG